MSKVATVSSKYLKTKFRFVKVVFIEAFSFIITHENVSTDRNQRRTHGYTINLVVTLSVKKKMSFSKCDLAKRNGFLS